MRTKLAGLEADKLKRDRDEVITLALSSGRIAPAEQKHWEAQLTRDHEGTALLLSSLQPRFSTVELGAATAREHAASTDDELNKLAEAAGL
jgi:phage I-like protein